MISKKRIISVAANGLAMFCNWKTRIDYAAARDILMLWSPKPQGHCFGENMEQIMYDLQIIIPAHNVEKYIEKCLNSLKPVLDCNHKILVQIVDDGSTDRTDEISNRFAKEMGESVTVIHQKNIGLAGARNAALKTILGEYIMFIDSDDYLMENVDFDFLIDSSSDCDILQGDHEMVDAEGNTIKRKRVNRLSGYAWGKLYRFTVLKHFCFPEGYWFEDTPVRFFLAGMGLTIKNTHECIYCHRKNPEGITAKALDLPKSIDSYWITELCLEEMPDFGIKYDQRAYDSFLHQSIINQIRVRRQPKKVRKAVFALTVELIDKYFPDVRSTEYAKIESAIRNRQFVKHALLSVANWCSQ